MEDVTDVTDVMMLPDTVTTEVISSTVVDVSTVGVLVLELDTLVVVCRVEVFGEVGAVIALVVEVVAVGVAEVDSGFAEVFALDVVSTEVGDGVVVAGGPTIPVPRRLVVVVGGSLTGASTCLPWILRSECCRANFL